MAKANDQGRYEVRKVVSVINSMVGVKEYKIIDNATGKKVATGCSSLGDEKAIKNAWENLRKNK